MKFRAKKDTFYSFVNSEGWNLLLLTFILWRLVDATLQTGNAWYFAALSPIVVLLLCPFERTSYELSSDKLVYRRGIFSGKIDLNRIKEIRKNRTVWMNLKKPATARNGLLIKYGNYEELYISPESNDQFIGHILKLNKSIRISD